MISDRPLYDAMAAGLERAEKKMDDLAIKGWRVAMVAYDPENPRAYMVLGTAGDEAFQQRIATLVNPADADKGPDYVAAQRCPTCGEICQPDDLKCDECGHDL